MLNSLSLGAQILYQPFSKQRGIIGSRHLDYLPIRESLARVQDHALRYVTEILQAKRIRKIERKLTSGIEEPISWRGCLHHLIKGSLANDSGFGDSRRAKSSQRVGRRRFALRETEDQVILPSRIFEEPEPFQEKGLMQSCISSQKFSQLFRVRCRRDRLDRHQAAASVRSLGKQTEILLYEGYVQIPFQMPRREPLLLLQPAAVRKISRPLVRPDIRWIPYQEVESVTKGSSPCLDQLGHNYVLAQEEDRVGRLQDYFVDRQGVDGVDLEPVHG